VITEAANPEGGTRADLGIGGPGAQGVAVLEHPVPVHAIPGVLEHDEPLTSG
jgi:hypothetical protein